MLRHGPIAQTWRPWAIDRVMHEDPAFSTQTRRHKIVVVIVLILICLALSYLVARGGHVFGHHGVEAPHVSNLLH